MAVSFAVIFLSFFALIPFLGASLGGHSAAPVPAIEVLDLSASEEAQYQLAAEEPNTEAEGLADLPHDEDSSAGPSFAPAVADVTHTGDGRQVIYISSGINFSLAIRADGTLWAWGQGADGKLGIGTTADHSVPQQVTGGPASWAAVSAGSTHAMGVGTDGSLWVWGNGTNGKLGLGTTASHSTPQRVGTLNTWDSVAAGYEHSTAIRTDGTLWTWGSNATGQLGIDVNGGTRNVPVQVSSGPPGGLWSMTAAGFNYTLGIGANGSLWGWGSGANHRLGKGNSSDSRAPHIISEGRSYVYVTASKSVDSAFGLAIDTVGGLWGWGASNLGQLGLGGTGNYSIPTRIVSGNIWTAVSAGGAFTLAVDSHHQLWAWGDGVGGKLGLGNQTQFTTPQRVTTGPDQWHMIEAGFNHSGGVTPDGVVWTWGLNTSGQLGKGTTCAGQGVGTDNFIPWRMAASVIPTSHLIWTPSPQGTVPNAGSAALTGDSQMVIHFDRSMCPEPESLGTISVDNGASVDISAGVWSDSARGPNTVFTLPLTITQRGALHTATVEGFVDDIFGQRDINEMYPHTWTFRTAAPLLVTEVTPAGIDVPVTTPELVITFNQAVNVGVRGSVTMNGQTLSLDGARWSEGNTVLSIPLSGLDYATRYDVVIFGFLSADATTMPAPHEHHFVTEARVAALAVEKTFLMPVGTRAPEASFIFDFEPLSFNGDASAAGQLPQIPSPSLSFSEASAWAAAPAVGGGGTGSVQAVLASENLLAGLDFAGPGIYRYRVSERSNTFASSATEQMNFDTRSYVLDFVVEAMPAPATGYYLAAITIREDLGDGLLGPDVAAGMDALTTVSFVNSFLRLHDNPAPLLDGAGLTVSKEVTGRFAFLGRYVSFDINVWIPQLADVSSYQAFVVDTKTGAVVTSELNGTIAGSNAYGSYLVFECGVPQTIALRHNQTLVFVDTHVGASYSACKSLVPGYNSTLAMTVSGAQSNYVAAITPDGAGTFSTQVRILGEARNAADFLNTHSDYIPTGLAVAANRDVLIGLGLFVLVIVASMFATPRLRRLSS